MPVILLRRPVSFETIDVLSTALADARSARVVGAAIVLIHPGRHFSIDYAGELVVRDPTAVRGMVAKLDDILSAL